RGDDAADDLGDPVRHYVLGRHTAGKEHAEGDGRVEMRPGDRSECIDPGDERQAEGKADRFLPERECPGKAACRHGGGSYEHQKKRTQNFREISLHVPLLLLRVTAIALSANRRQAYAASRALKSVAL